MEGLKNSQAVAFRQIYWEVIRKRGINWIFRRPAIKEYVWVEPQTPRWSPWRRLLTLCSIYIFIPCGTVCWSSMVQPLFFGFHALAGWFDGSAVPHWEQMQCSHQLPVRIQAAAVPLPASGRVNYSNKNTSEHEADVNQTPHFWKKNREKGGDDWNLGEEKEKIFLLA